MKAPRLFAFPLKVGERGALFKALARAGLPTDDLEAQGHCFWRFETADQVPVGFGGLEFYGEDALLRFVLTLPPLRGRGIGSVMVTLLEREAAFLGCSFVWPLTPSAGKFFDRLGYAKCDRAVVPESIKDTREFAALCGADADVLVKRLAV